MRFFFPVTVLLSMSSAKLSRAMRLPVKKQRAEAVRKGIVFESIKAFIQNVHHFRDEALLDTINPPFEHVVIFDEAQRAWNLRKTANFMHRKKGEAWILRNQNRNS